MTSIGRITPLLILPLALGLAPADDPKAEPLKKPASLLDMSKAVACKRVDGFEDFTPLPDATLTSEDKLKVYYRPLRYKVERVPNATLAGKPVIRYRAKLVQDGRIRRKGEKTPVSKEDSLLEHEAVFEDPTYQICLINTIGLKNLAPGDYEFDIVLHDALDEGATATQTLSFTVIAPPKGETPAKAEEKAEELPTKAKPKAKTKRPGRTGG